MADFTLRLRRYDPQSGEAPYWDQHTVDLEPHRSVLEGILQAKARFDGSIGIRCSCRAAICGSCGERVKDQAEDPHGIFDSTHCFKCIEACPKGVAPMSQIMRLRRIATGTHHIAARNHGERHASA